MYKKYLFYAFVFFRFSLCVAFEMTQKGPVSIDQEEYFPYPANREHCAVFRPFYQWSFEEPCAQDVCVERLNTLTEQTRFSVAQAMLILGDAYECKNVFKRLRKLSKKNLHDVLSFESPTGGTIGSFLSLEAPFDLYAQYLASLKRLSFNDQKKILCTRVAANKWQSEFAIMQKRLLHESKRDVAFNEPCLRWIRKYFNDLALKTFERKRASICTERVGEFSRLFSWVFEDLKNEATIVQRLHMPFESFDNETSFFSTAQTLLLLGNSKERTDFFVQISKLTSESLKKVCQFVGPSRQTLGAFIAMHLPLGRYIQYFDCIQSLEFDFIKSLVSERSIFNMWLGELAFVCNRMIVQSVHADYYRRVQAQLLLGCLGRRILKIIDTKLLHRGKSFRH